MDSPRSLIVLDPAAAGEAAGPRPETILAGAPRAQAANQYADERGEFFCGVWSCTAGRWRIRYTEHRRCAPRRRRRNRRRPPRRYWQWTSSAIYAPMPGATCGAACG